MLVTKLRYFSSLGIILRFDKRFFVIKCVVLTLGQDHLEDCCQDHLDIHLETAAQTVLATTNYPGLTTTSGYKTNSQLETHY